MVDATNLFIIPCLKKHLLNADLLINPKNKTESPFNAREVARASALNRSRLALLDGLAELPDDEVDGPGESGLRGPSGPLGQGVHFGDCPHTKRNAGLTSRTKETGETP